MTVGAVPAGQTLQACGSLPQTLASDHLSTRRRLRLLVELGVLFIAAPLLIRHAVFALNVPLPLALQPVLLVIILFLLWDTSFRLRRELGAGIPKRALLSIGLMFAVVGGALAWYVHDQMPWQFLSFPKRNTPLWAMVMVMYPLMSVIPQELVYRTFYFHRYGPLFGRWRRMAILVNGALFGFAHIIFATYASIVLTAVLGVLLAWRYEQTRSYWAVWLEHSLYGCLIFTVGLGHLFFTGVSTLN